MANLSLRHVCKIYPARGGAKKSIFNFKKKKAESNARVGDFIAVKDFNMEIEDGEFIVFVGPSGCGKSTTLRMIAGLEDISAGELYIDDRLVNNVDAKDRDIAMVFQSYALYPHMTSYENISFGLKMRKIPDIKRDKNGNPVLDKDGNEIHIMRHHTRAEIDEKVQWAAGILGIKELLQSKPSDMSGGQRQRIALGRAMVRGPKVFLLDEPLSNLDAKLRTTMRSEIVKLHKALKTTFIYVTHDQVEAMTMGSRIVVMKDGYVQQIDSPTNLFDYPENKFVAGFIGTPQMNFFRVTIVAKVKYLYATFANGESIKLSLDKLRPVKEEYLDGQPHEVYLGLRGEHVQVCSTGISVNVSITEILGSDMHIFFRIDGEEGEFIACVSGRTPLNANDKLYVNFSEKNVHLFDAETEKSILGKAE
ncbi:MAG: ATP-binding cassette domain-containing protein [Clostridia bacterium]|nr:ATP-binding cassette domain-containing protein [Clostridia bacterium]